MIKELTNLRKEKSVVGGTFLLKRKYSPIKHHLKNYIVLAMNVHRYNTARLLQVECISLKDFSRLDVVLGHIT